jgi:hypothetical protein
MGLLTPRPDEGFVPKPGGLLDGLPEHDGGSSLDLFMTPEEIAQIDGLGNENRGAQPLKDSGPIAQELKDNNHNAGAGDTFSGQGSAGNGVVGGDDKSLPRSSLGETLGDAAGKIWNSPNSAIGMAYGGLGYLAGWPMHWLGLQDKPGVTAGNNAVQFTNNPLIAPNAAVTLGNVEVFHGEPTDRADKRSPPIGQHEEQHAYQGEQLGPLYLPSNIFGGAAGELIDGYWHGPHNWNEVGPNQPRPVPWPR